MRPKPSPDRFPALASKHRQGFTLVEAVTVIAITGVIAAAVAVFMRLPVQGYVDTARRAELADAADTALRRIGRDLRLALPNSVRVNAAGNAVEFLITRAGGRYRSDAANTGPAGDPLDFTDAADSAFDLIGPGVEVRAGDLIAVYNLGIPGASAYNGETVRAFAGAPGAVVSNIAFTPTATPYPFASPGKRFQVVQGPVTYWCDPVSGNLLRYWGYPITPAQAVPPAGGQNALLAGGVACRFTYDASVVAQRAGLVTAQLTLTRSGEAVTLYHSVHVDNVP